MRAAINESVSVSKTICESHTWRLVSSKALRELNARWALPVYPDFENENRSSEWVRRKMGQTKSVDKKSVKRKIALK